MPLKLVAVNLAQLEKRTKALKLLSRIYSASFKGPSYSGKAHDIDRVKKAETIAHNLDFDLAADVMEGKERT